jgi:hypothetical protein
MLVNARRDLNREDAPDLQQTAGEHGGPGPDDEAWLQEQGYPKLGRGTQARVTQVEHGPYAGGTQQGDAETEQRVGEQQPDRQAQSSAG